MPSRPVWLAALLAVAAGSIGAAPREHTVVIDAMAYQPATLTVKRGDRVTWVNRDLVPHTATAAGRAFDTGLIETGSARTLTVDELGTLRYDCSYHPPMKGTLVVEP
jgi:plastocyanin